MKTVKVVAAIIVSEGMIFATQRGYGPYRGGWEFPGGKVEFGETKEEALKREIQEELDAEIQVGELAGHVEYDYPEFHLSMDCFYCSLISENLKLKEHEAAKWLSTEDLWSVEWLPADEMIVNQLQKRRALHRKSVKRHSLENTGEEGRGDDQGNLVYTSSH